MRRETRIDRLMAATHGVPITNIVDFTESRRHDLMVMFPVIPRTLYHQVVSCKYANDGRWY